MDKVNREMVVMGTGKGKTLELAKQDAAKQGINYFGKMGISKKIPDAYLKFCI